MKKSLFIFQVCLAAALLAGCAAPAITPTPAPQPPAPPSGSLLETVSADEMLATIRDLTEIEVFSGWRNSSSSGEAQALDYMEERLRAFSNLQAMGLTTERQTFNVQIGAELRETSLYLDIDGKIVEVPADGLRGHRDDPNLALRFDSDGRLNDSQPDPVEVENAAVYIASEEALNAAPAAELRGKIFLVPYAMLDRSRLGVSGATAVSARLLSKDPAGIVMVTQYSTRPGESNGAFVGDGSGFTTAESPHTLPILYTRLEDLAAAGIHSLDDLAAVDGARLVWDADISAPAASGNLIARIPGQDASKAVILGAHIDSPNAPGAMDDGSGSAVLLEVARVFNAAALQPPVDVVLVWFGSEELGLYGSAHFTATHQELLDRTIAMLQIDDLTRPLDGVPADLYLVTWSASALGKPQMPWPQALSGLGAEAGIPLKVVDEHSIYSDNNSFGGYNVPNLNLIYMSPEMESLGGVWVAGTIHSPYDTLERAQEMRDVLQQMGQVALLAATRPGPDPASYRVTPPARQRAVFVASCTEAAHMTPGTFLEMGMALSLAGLDVDLIPYGQAVTPQDLQDASLVVALPCVDYAYTNAAPSAAALSAESLQALQDYAEAGGLLLITNSAHQLKYGNTVMAPNEDALAMNDLAGRFGVTFTGQTHADGSVSPSQEHPLLESVSGLQMAGSNGMVFEMQSGSVLAGGPSGAVIGLAPAGEKGEVIILADVALLNNAWGSSVNTAFWKALASYSLER